MKEKIPSQSEENEAFARNLEFMDLGSLEELLAQIIADRDANRREVDEAKELIKIKQDSIADADHREELLKAEIRKKSEK